MKRKRPGSYRWDPKRNTSAVHRPPSSALPNALRALAELRDEDPQLVAWIAAGHPTLTAAEHRARFGGDYTPTRTRKVAP